MAGMRRARTTVWGTAALAAALLLAGCGGMSVERSSSSTAAVEGPTTTSPSTTNAPSTTAPSTTGTKPPSPSTKTSTKTSKPSTTSTTSKPSSTSTTRKPAPSTTAKPSPSTTKPAPKPAPKPAVSAGDTLKPGMSGAYVKQVQQRLSALGYWLGTPDGGYGGLTTQAVMALQKAAGLGRDGVFGPQTAKALAAGTRPSARIGGTGIEIDKARQLLLVVRGGRVTTILNTSTGSGQPYVSSYGTKAIATTPSGSFRVYYVVDGLNHGKLGDLWRPRFFNGGIAVHGAGYVPGYPASHGCARVSNPAIDMIWANNLMPMGSTVTVY